MLKRNLILSLFLICLGAASGYEYRDIFAESPKTCFTPGENCTGFIINEINGAQKEIYVQAYGFTDKDIMQSLIHAKKRGVDVRIILDKSNLHASHSRIEDIKLSNIKHHIDLVPGIAHNKVMIFDRAKILTGSFNFSKAANNRNSENIILINNTQLAERYYQNWLKRASHE